MKHDGLGRGWAFVLLYEVGLAAALGVFLALGFTDLAFSDTLYPYLAVAGVVLVVTLILSYLVLRRTHSFSGRRLLTWFVTLLPGMVALWLLVMWLMARPESSFDVWLAIALNSLYFLVPTWLITGLATLISWISTKKRRRVAA